jgi:flavorubredoxin
MDATKEFMPAAKGLPRLLTERLYWLGDCLERVHPSGVTLHTYHSAYVVVGDMGSAVIDTGHPKDWAVIATQIDELHQRGVPEVRYVVPTHPEVPHSGNAGRWLAKYPQARLAGEIRDYHLIFPEYLDRLQAIGTGDEIELGGATLRFTDAVIRDLIPTVWPYFVEDQALFPSDGFAYVHEHERGQCGRVAEEVPMLRVEEYTAMFSDAALYWTRFTDMEGPIAALDESLERYPSRIIAPGHGLPIVAPDQTLPRVREGLRLGAAGAVQGMVAESL